MKLSEIEMCLEKYALNLNEYGGVICVNVGDSIQSYIITTDPTKSGRSYRKVTVDGADLIIHSKDKNGYPLEYNRVYRIPYHSITYVSIYEDWS